MYSIIRRISYLSLVFVLLTPLLFSQGRSGIPFRFGFQIFTDYYHTLNHFDSRLKDSSGFDITRVNITFDYTIDSSYDTRIRLESDDRNSILNNTALATFIKDLWLRYRFNNSLNSEFIFGIQQTPNYRMSELNWGYRSIERMQMDFERILGTRDFGLLFRTDISSSLPLNFSLLFANNSSVSRETDNRKRIYASLELEQPSGFDASVAADYQALANDGKGYTCSFYTGYITPGWRVGGEAFYHEKVFNIQAVSPSKNVYFRGISMFGNYSLKSNVDFLLRLDYTARNLPAEFQESTLLISGVDYHPNESVHIIPNLTFQNETQNSSATAIFKLTVNWEL